MANGVESFAQGTHDVLLSALEKRRFARESLLVTQITLYGQT